MSNDMHQYKDTPGPMVVIIESCTVEQARKAGKAMAQAAGITGVFAKGTIEDVYQRKAGRRTNDSHR